MSKLESIKAYVLYLRAMRHACMCGGVRERETGEGGLDTSSYMMCVGERVCG